MFLYWILFGVCCLLSFACGAIAVTIVYESKYECIPGGKCYYANLNQGSVRSVDVSS